MPIVIFAKSRVYPRACGGTRDGRVGIIPMNGLSPRVRGNQVRARLRRARRGSIPARAGEPEQMLTTSRKVVVYPRACGRTLSGLPRPTCMRGLSPRVRGNPLIMWSADGSARSIPARAGEPMRCALLASCKRVYPRACGGTRSHTGALGRVYGLSPRVRGNLRESEVAVDIEGSIPARAGEPVSETGRPDGYTVYPRACGGT